MRKAILLCSIFIFCLSSVIKAQTPKSFEIKPGLSLAKQIWDFSDIDYGVDIKYHPGMYVGINAEFIHHKWISILTEGGFTVKILNEGPKTYSLDYVYLSPLFKVRKEFGNIIPYIFAGPRIDFLLTPEAEEYFFTKQSFNKVIYGVIYGMCLEYMFSPFALSLGFHQQIDINNSLDKEYSFNNQVSFKQNTFVLFLGLKVYFQKKPKSK